MTKHPVKRTLFFLFFAGFLFVAHAGTALDDSFEINTRITGLHLYLEKIPGVASLRLLAENRGSDPVLIMRPRAGMLDHYRAWGGWSVRLNGPGGAFRPIVYPGASIPETASDLIELRPGEAFGVNLSLAGYVREPECQYWKYAKHTWRLFLVGQLPVSVNLCI
ncbi:MAG: hypothetical protein CVV41_22915 [Candidatus Riflebacteria bacterium HGW-Riflebacteria-1]|jgi:hypothetical protein|nr:MAG: hypothetical protein CVV41_22915 [Candidatus Riflebacteria bacterium HGW-Riflebacteria-1]